MSIHVPSLPLDRHVTILLTQSILSCVPALSLNWFCKKIKLKGKVCSEFCPACFVQIDFVAHDDIPYSSAGSEDVYKHIKEAGELPEHTVTTLWSHWASVTLTETKVYCISDMCPVGQVCFR